MSHCTGKKLLGRSHVKRVAQKRVVGITEYCKVTMMSSVDHVISPYPRN